jgi:hypothetical protein
LHGQPYNLRQQDSQQHQEISIADKERFHGESSAWENIKRKARAGAPDLDFQTWGNN